MVTILTFAYTGGVDHEVTIQWYLDGVALVDGIFGDTTVSGATTTTLTLTDPTSAYTGSYYATVTDEDVANCVVTTGIIPVVIPACSIAITVQPIDVTTNEGNTVQLTVAYDGEAGNVTFQWYRDGIALVDGLDPSGATIAGATTDTLEITDSAAALSGDYYVILTDDGFLDCTTQSETVVVTITETVDCTVLIDEQPEGGLFLDGATVELSFTYTGGVGPFTVQWYRDAVALVDGASGDSDISGATTTDLVITDWTDALSGSYYAIVVDTGIADCQAQTSTIIVDELNAPPGSFLWYKADEDSQIYGNGDLAIPLIDRSGNGHDLYFTNTSPAQREPHMLYAAKNGLAVWEWLTFPCTVDTRAFFPPFSGNGVTIGIVKYKDREYVSVAVGTAQGPTILASEVPQQRLYDLRDASDLTYTWQYTSTIFAGTTLPGNYEEWYVITAYIDFTAGVPTLKLNDVESSGVATAGGAFFDVLSQSGSPGDRIAEIIIYDTRLSDDNIDLLRQYLSAKWDIPITV